MAKRKAAKSGPAAANKAGDGVEPMVIALAEQLGSFLGRVRAKADGFMESEAVRQQVTQIRDGAAELMNQVNRAGAAAGESATKLAEAAKSAMPAARAKKAAAAKRASIAEQKRLKSREPVAAPGKKHRKPPPQEKFERGMTQSKAILMGQKGIKGRMQRGGSSQ